MARALRGRLVAMDARIQTSAERYLAEGWGRRGARNLMTIARYLLGADPAALARSYDRSRSGNRSHGDAGPGDD